jgi:hypothetical protein
MTATALPYLVRSPSWDYHGLLGCDGRPHPLHFSAFDAANDDQARQLVAERWLASEPELRLLIVRQDGARLVKVPDRETPSNDN